MSCDRVGKPLDPYITDHALLRWMERVHGVDVEGWRELMRLEVAAALEAFEGRERPGIAAFVVTPEHRVVTVLLPTQRQSLIQSGIAVPRVA